MSIMIKKLHVLRAKAGVRPSGYIADVFANAAWVDQANGAYGIESDRWEALKQKYRKPNDASPAPAAPVAAVPRFMWPLWAQGLAVFASDSDAGVGDTVARVVGPIGGEAFKKWHKHYFGKECGCTGRQELWNKQYPYARSNNGPQN
jgi:hypothetical protein